MEGLQQHDTGTEDTFEQLQYEKTPQEWLLYSYPAHGNLMVYIENLKQRIKYIRGLCDIAAEGEFRVRKFWLPGFFNQRNFLTTVLQEASRKKGQPIEQFQITYRIMSENEKEYSARKAAGLGCYYIHGLHLYGASYSTERETLEDLHIKSPIGLEMPMIHMLVEQQDSIQESPRFIDAPLTRNRGEVVQDLESPSSCVAPQGRTADLGKCLRDHYQCPMFVTFAKNRVDNTRVNQMAEGRVITYVPIPVKGRDPKFWIKRNISLLCYAEEHGFPIRY